MRYWINQVSPKFKDKCPYQRYTEERHREAAYVKMWAENGVMWPQAKETWSHQDLEEAKYCPPLEPSEEAQSCHPLISDFWLPDHQENTFPLFKTPSWWSFVRTDTETVQIEAAWALIYREGEWPAVEMIEVDKGPDNCWSC